MNLVEKNVPERQLAFFTEADSAEVVNARTAPETDPRLGEIVAVVVKHLHAAVKELRLTNDEWFRAIEFLTRTGQSCNEWRQEFILLSDILGVSMLVDAINHDRPDGSTENTVLGPFYVANSPRYESGANINLDGKGEPMVVRGRVLDLYGKPIAGALLEAWQTNIDGFYDVQQKGIQPVNNLRGAFTTDANGEFWFRSAKPLYYPIPVDGPVGNLLQLLGRNIYRPAHLHFIVSASGYDTVVTHIFTPDCQYLTEDPVFGVKKSLIADFKKVEDLAEAEKLGFKAPFWSVDWNFVMAPKASA
jgi:catechol 1,2-dioxygenase